MTLSPQQQAVLYRFLLILVITDLPILSVQLSQPAFDWRLLLAGLLTGAAGAVEKSLGPQLASTILPNATVMPDTKQSDGITVAGLVGPVVVPPSQSRAG